MKIGDKVEILHPFDGNGYRLIGTIVSFYRDNRAVVKTSSGHSWAIEKKQLKKIGR